MIASRFDYLLKVRTSDIAAYRRVLAERLSALDPNDLALARELAASYVQKADHKRALTKLQICFKADPRDADTLNLLAQAFDRPLDLRCFTGQLDIDPARGFA